MARLKTLVLANRLPYPLDDGWKRRTFHVLRGLASEAPVTLITFDRGAEAETIRALLGEITGLEVRTVPSPPLAKLRAVLLGALTPTPFPVWRVRSRQLEAQVRELCEGGEVGRIVVEVAYMFRNVDRLAGRYCTIVDTHNIDSLVLERYAVTMRGARRWYARMTAMKLKAYEARTFETAREVWVCSEAEARSLAGAVPEARCVVVPNGVDTSYFTPTGAQEAGDQANRDLLFFGRLDYYPNADAVRHFIETILPVIWARDASVRFTLAGRGEVDESVRRLAATDPRIRILGAVPDLRPVIEEAAVVVVPLRSGGGTRLKILEALAMARPVVTSTIGMEGLDLVPGRDLEVADQPEHFAAQTLELLNDPVRARAMGRSGREAVVARFDWRAIEADVQRRVRHLSSDTRTEPGTMDRIEANRVSRVGSEGG